MSAVAELRESSSVGGQLGRFLVVGLSNTALSVSSYALLLRAGMPYVAAGVIAFALGAVNGYTLNRRWTFQAVGSLRAQVSYVAVQALGLGLTAGLLWLAVEVVSAGEQLAQLAVIPAVTLTTFLLNRLVVFRRRAA